MSSSPSYPIMKPMCITIDDCGDAGCTSSEKIPQGWGHPEKIACVGVTSDFKAVCYGPNCNLTSDKDLKTYYTSYRDCTARDCSAHATADECSKNGPFCQWWGDDVGCANGPDFGCDYTESTLLGDCSDILDDYYYNNTTPDTPDTRIPLPKEQWHATFPMKVCLASTLATGAWAGGNPISMDNVTSFDPEQYKKTTRDTRLALQGEQDRRLALQGEVHRADHQRRDYRHARNTITCAACSQCEVSMKIPQCNDTAHHHIIDNKCYRTDIPGCAKECVLGPTQQC